MSELFEICHVNTEKLSKDKKKKIDEETLDKVKEFLKKNKSYDINKGPIYGLTALHHACQSSLFQVVKYLVDSKRAKVDVKSKYKMYPIHYAAEVGDLEIVKYLISKKATYKSFFNYRHITCLHVASENGHYDVVQYLLNRGADANVKNVCTYFFFLSNFNVKPQDKKAIDLTSNEKIKKLLKEHMTDEKKIKVDMKKMPYSKDKYGQKHSENKQSKNTGMYYANKKIL